MPLSIVVFERYRRSITLHDNAQSIVVIVVIGAPGCIWVTRYRPISSRFRPITICLSLCARIKAYELRERGEKVVAV